jgi:hypothetical protein
VRTSISTYPASFIDDLLNAIRMEVDNANITELSDFAAPIACGLVKQLGPRAAHVAFATLSELNERRRANEKAR